MIELSEVLVTLPMMCLSFPWANTITESATTKQQSQVLIAQRTLFQLQTDYIASLESLWVSTVPLKGI